MGAIVKGLTSLIGLGSTPKVDTSAADDEVSNQQAADQNARSALLETAGAGAGAPLQPGQTQPRSTLFGN